MLLQHTRQTVNPSPLTAIAICLSLWLSASPLRAEPPDSRWILRGYALSLSEVDDHVTAVRTTPTAGEERTTHSVTDGSGVGLSLELLLTKKIGVEFAALFGELDNDFQLDMDTVSLTDSETMGTETFSLGVNYHFTPERRADFFVGAFVGMGTFDDVIFLTEAGLSEKLTFDDDFGFGVKVGVDVRLRADSRWFLTAEVRYLVMILESEVPGQDLDLNPVIPSIGIGYRF